MAIDGVEVGAWRDGGGSGGSGAIGMVVCFFSSRRRHTRCSRDWSSDVCSSDLHDSILEWLQGYYRDRDNHAAELEMTETLFRTEPSLRRYQELRGLATRLGRWETLRPEMVAYLEQGGNTRLLIQIALDEGEIDKALQLLKGMAKKDSYGYTYDGGLGYYGYSSKMTHDGPPAA